MARKLCRPPAAAGNDIRDRIVQAFAGETLTEASTMKTYDKAVQIERWENEGGKVVSPAVF